MSECNHKTFIGVKGTGIVYCESCRHTKMEIYLQAQLAAERKAKEAAEKLLEINNAFNAEAHAELNLAIFSRDKYKQRAEQAEAQLAIMRQHNIKVHGNKNVHIFRLKRKLNITLERAEQAEAQVAELSKTYLDGNGFEWNPINGLRHYGIGKKLYEQTERALRAEAQCAAMQQWINKQFPSMYGASFSNIYCCSHCGNVQNGGHREGVCPRYFVEGNQAGTALLARMKRMEDALSQIESVPNCQVPECCPAGEMWGIAFEVLKELGIKDVPTKVDYKETKREKRFKRLEDALQYLSELTIEPESEGWFKEKDGKWITDAELLAFVQSELREARG